MDQEGNGKKFTFSRTSPSGSTDLLVNQPLAGRLVPEVPGRELRELIEANYRIVYRVNGTVAEILTVFEAHKRFSRD